MSAKARFAVVAAFIAGLSMGSDGLAGEAGGLFSEDRNEVLDYLRTHRIPRWVRQPRHGVPPDADAPMRAEVKRAAEVFVAGDAEMRLAVVSAMDIFYDEGARMWDACGRDDYETRHYLVWRLADADAGARAREARQWLLDETHPSLAAPILRVICNSRYLLKDASIEEEQGVLGLLRKLYRQGGSMVCHYRRAEFPGDSGPVEKYVVRALRRLTIREARGQLLEWMINDGKKSTPSVRWEMWSTLAYFRKSLISVTHVKEFVRQDELVELWAVTPPSEVFDPRAKIRPDIGRLMMSGTRYRDKALSNAFNRALISQLGNPDLDVRQGVVRYLVGQRDAGELVQLVRKIELTTLGKEQVKELLEREFSARKKDAKATEVEALENWRGELLEAFGREGLGMP